MEKSRLETKLVSGPGHSESNNKTEVSGNRRERDTLITVGSVNSDIEVSITCITFFGHTSARMLNAYGTFNSCCVGKAGHQAQGGAKVMPKRT